MRKSSASLNFVQISSTILLSFILANCGGGGAEKKDTAEPSMQSWSSSMQSLKVALTDLMPIVMDPKKFQEDAQQERVNRDVKSLLQTSKQMSHDPMMTQRDPTLRFVGQAFQEDLRRVEESLSMGRKEYARYALMNITSYCIECHTRTSSGPSFQTPEIEKSLADLGRLERGEFLLATRQFDRALNEFDQLMKSEIKKDPNLFQLDRAVRYSLAITVRFRQDPRQAMQVVDSLIDAPGTPFYLKASAQQWKKALQAWLSEKKQPSKKPKDILNRSRSWVELAKKSQSGISDRSGDVYYLRALTELLSLMESQKDAATTPEALYLIGVAYDSVRDLSVWSLHENYFEACVRQAPGTRWSSLCYKKLEESLLSGFTGSSGTRLPMDVQVRLRDLKKLAVESPK